MRRALAPTMGVLAGAGAALYATAGGAVAATTYSVGPISNLSATSCSGANAEVVSAVDPKLGYVYEEWMGCSKIAFARSTDGGKTFEPAYTLPCSIGSNLNAWDPALAVAPDGTVYAAFMVAKSSQWYPVVAA